MKYFIIAGEASGDLHGAALMKALKETDRQARFVFFGGNLMEAAGGKLIRHFRDMAFMGAIDVIKNIGKINDNFILCKKAVTEEKPDVLILIDYPGFNLKMAAFAHLRGIPVFYYILPKVWAWKAWRVKKLKRYTDGLFSIFPFEEDFFRKSGVNVHFVGNPLTDFISEAKKHFRSKATFLHDNHLPDKPVVALLPGSRAQEVKMILPLMSRLAGDFQAYQFVIAGTAAVDRSLYTRYSRDLPVLTDQTYELVSHSHAAIVASGTATLETALLNTPQIVLYKMAGGKTGYALFRFLFLKVKFVSLPNLILNNEALREFVMDQMKYENVLPETGKLLTDQVYRKKILDSYGQMKGRMGEPGAATRAAELMVSMLHNNKNNR